MAILTPEFSGADTAPNRAFPAELVTQATRSALIDQTNGIYARCGVRIDAPRFGTYDEPFVTDSTTYTQDDDNGARGLNTWTPLVSDTRAIGDAGDSDHVRISVLATAENMQIRARLVSSSDGGATVYQTATATTTAGIAAELQIDLEDELRADARLVIDARSADGNDAILYAICAISTILTPTTIP